MRLKTLGFQLGYKLVNGIDKNSNCMNFFFDPIDIKYFKDYKSTTSLLTDASFDFHNNTIY